MRITGGSLVRHTIRVPKQQVRPTQDRVREALFGSLGARVCDARVLDLFAGSGAMGLEAWSRGAQRVCFVEADRSVYRVLKQNVEKLCAAEPTRETVCICGDVFRFLRHDASGAPQDVILADPPYAAGDEDGLLQKTLRAIRRNDILSPTGVLVYEQSTQSRIVSAPGWVVRHDKPYGRTRLLFFELSGTTHGEEHH